MKNNSLFFFNFEDKEILFFWLGYFLVTLFISWIFFIAGIIFFFGTYSISFNNYTKYRQLENYLHSKKVEFEKGKANIIVVQKGYRIGGPFVNKQHNVAIELKEITINYIKTQKGICFFPYKKELGLVKIFQKPFVITNEKNNYPDFFYLKQRICNNFKINDENKIIVDCTKLYKDIDKIEINRSENIIQI